MAMDARELYERLLAPEVVWKWRQFTLSHRRRRAGTVRELAELYRSHGRKVNAAAAETPPVVIRVLPEGVGSVARVWDGVHRWRAARDARVTRMPVIVTNASGGAAKHMILRMAPPKV